MKVVITQLKAPWPAGAKVGDVVEMRGFGKLPGWAAGKCRPAGDADASHVLDRPILRVSEPQKPALALLAEANAKLEALAAELAEAQATVMRLQDGKTDEQREIEAQAAAEKAEADRKDELLAEAKALGVKADGRWSVDRLSEEVAKAKKG